MSWRERDYHRGSYEPGARIGGLRLPPPASTGLLVAHVAAFLVLWIVQLNVEGDVTATLVLAGEALSPAGILLHPLATTNLLTLAITMFIIWVLAGRLETLCGARRVLVLYAMGNLLAGCGYYLIAHAAPALAMRELDYPTGALAAWAVALWRLHSGQDVSVFGKTYRATSVFAVVFAAAIGLTLLFGGVGALAWLAAIVLGGLVWPAIEIAGALAERRLQAGPRRPMRREPRVRPSVRLVEMTFEDMSPEHNVDDILAKISREGIEALTPDERERLDAARQALLQESR